MLPPPPGADGHEPSAERGDALLYCGSPSAALAVDPAEVQALCGERPDALLLARLMGDDDDDRVCVVDDEKHYMVESVLAARQKGGRTEYLTAWVGYDDQTWEPARNFVGEEAKERLAAFKREHMPTPASPGSSVTPGSGGPGCR